MPLLAFLGPLKCVCRTAFFMAFLIFPAAAETAAPPISGSNGLMGLWGGNSSAPQTGSSGKPISGSNEQQGATAPGTPTELSPPSADSQDAELESSPPSAPRNVVPPPISGSNGLMGEGGANSSELQTGSSGKPISGSNDQQDTGIPTEFESTERGCTGCRVESVHGCRAQVEVPPDAELKSSPPSAPRNVAPSPSAQSGSNGLIEWSANSSELQTGSSTDLSVAPSPSAQSGSEGSIGEWGTSGSAAQTGSGAHTSGKAFNLNGQHANVGSDIVTPVPDTQTELSPSGAPPEQSLEATTPPASKVLVIIDKPTQKMKVFVDDVELYSWKVSSGLPGYATPSGAYNASSMNEIWYSKEWDDAPMPHAIFFTKKGHAIHGTEETKKLGRPASHGCVRLAPEDARTLFALVKEKGLENTEIVLNGETPGGDSRVARTGPRKQQINRAKTRVYAAPPRRFGRGGWSQRRFGGRSRQGFYWRY